MTLGKLLKKIRNEKGYSLVKLQDLSGVTQGYISDIENEKKGVIPKKDKLEDIIKALNPEEEEKKLIIQLYADLILTQDMKKVISESGQIQLKGNARILSGQEELGTIELPVYGKASAGNGYINFEEILRVQKITSIPGVDLPKGSFIIEVGGDSMFPTLLDGDLAIVKPVIDCEEADGRICVVTWNDQTFIKRVKYQKGIVILMSDNPDRMKYQDVFIEKDELQYLKCHGIVVESRRKY